MTEQISKTEFRKQALKLRSAIEGRESKSQQIVQRLVSHSDFVQAQTVLLYVSIRSEVETHALIQTLLANSAKRILVPYCVGDVLRIFPLDDWDQLTPKTFGVLEPHDEAIQYATEFRAASVELTIVPGVAFDRQRNRLGYGKGYYDQLLSTTVPQSRRIAIAFDSQVFDSIPTTENDIPMHEIITESKVIR